MGENELRLGALADKIRREIDPTVQVTVREVPLLHRVDVMLRAPWWRAFSGGWRAEQLASATMVIAMVRLPGVMVNVRWV